MFKNDIDKTIFLNLIRNGQGFSKSCHKSGYDVKSFSMEYLNPDNKLVKEEIDNSFKLGLIDLISERDRILKQDDKYFLETTNNILDSFISKVHTWGCGLNEFQKEAIEENGFIIIYDQMIMSGLEQYGNLHEVATAYAQTYSELLEVVTSNTSLRYLINTKKNVK